ncbi:VOC family protein [Brevibacillus brevis]|uniref:VOC family protein n=1 Tax=Brevibacillus brevis TaxID=1393 RepID=UPI0025A68385|nr:VOC family protein [Brevibacillus brevis]WJQ83073.1 VOC family protein [Brevibacillus brevis]
MAQSLFKGMEGVFIPVTDPGASAKWYEEKLGCRPLFVEEEAVTMRISDESSTVICLVRVENHQPMTFPENQFGVGKYYNFLPADIEAAHQLLTDWDVPVLNEKKGKKLESFFDPVLFALSSFPSSFIPVEQRLDPYARTPTDGRLNLESSSRT